MDNEVVRRLMWAGMVAATGALASVVAYRSFRAGAPPVPELAIEEAKRTKETLTGP